MQSASSSTTVFRSLGEDHQRLLRLSELDRLELTADGPRVGGRARTRDPQPQRDNLRERARLPGVLQGVASWVLFLNPGAEIWRAISARS